MTQNKVVSWIKEHIPMLASRPDNGRISLAEIDDTLNEIRDQERRVCQAADEIAEDAHEVREMMGEENAANHYSSST